MKKILLIKRRALGDTVLLTSTVALLKEHDPQNQITVLIPRAWRAVFENNPQVKSILCFEDFNVFSLLFKVRAFEFDIVLDLHSSGRNSWIGRLSGAPVFAAHAQNKQTEQAYGKHPNALEWDMFFLHQLGLVEQKTLVPRIFFRDEELAKAKNFWLSKGADPRRLVFLGLGASRSTKRWPPEYYARLCELIRDRLEFCVGIVSGEAEEDQLFAGSVLDHLRVKGFRPQLGPNDKGGVIFQSGLSVRELAAAIAVAKVYVGNDSGPKHLAVAAGVASLTFFGPEDPVEWHPYNDPRHQALFQAGLACRKEDNGRWCGISVCIVEKHRCMTMLSAELAFERLTELL